MPAHLVSDRYGKSAIRLVKVVREGPRHTVHDLTIDVHLEGDFRAAHIDGDNSAVLPTDTMKNTVYALARQLDVDPPEGFAAQLGARLLDTSPHATRVTIEVARQRWNRIPVSGVDHNTTFEHASPEARVASVSTVRGASTTVEAGIRDLVVMRTAGSAFAGFARDRYTTLSETRDRIFATSVSARWRYGDGQVDPNAAFAGVRQALTETFATHASESVQHTAYAMGAAALRAGPALEEIRLSLPNRHHLLVDLAPFGLDNPNAIFVATTEPYGLIEAVIRREG